MALLGKILFYIWLVLLALAVVYGVWFYLCERRSRWREIPPQARSRFDNPPKDKAL